MSSRHPMSYRPLPDARPDGHEGARQAPEIESLCPNFKSNFKSNFHEGSLHPHENERLCRLFRANLIPSALAIGLFTFTPALPSLSMTGAAMTKTIIQTDHAPQAIGTYSQAVKVGNTVYLSGQIPLVPETMELVTGDMETQIRRVFDNLAAVAAAAGGSLADMVKLNVYLTDLGHFPLVNQVMATYFQAPYPARAAVGVAALPKGAAVEMDGILVLP